MEWFQERPCYGIIPTNPPLREWIIQRLTNYRSSVRRGAVLLEYDIRLKFIQLWKRINLQHIWVATQSYYIFGEKKWFNDTIVKQSVPHIRFFTAPFDFSFDMWLFWTSILNVMFIYLSEKMKFWFVRKQNSIQKQFVGFLAMQHFNCKFKAFRIIIRM